MTCEPSRLASRLPTLADRLHAAVETDWPLPGHGRTLERWRRLAAAAACDLSLAKLVEGHFDALAILAELRGPAAPAGSVWGTWCAEPPTARLRLEPAAAGDEVRLSGTKAWCSGALLATHAIVSAWNAAGEPCLAAVALDQPGVQRTNEGWHAVGMAATGSVDVRFRDVPARQVGRPNDYVRRPGFWHGGAGIAACWWGGAQAVAAMTREALAGRSQPDPHASAHLGAIDVALSESAALLREAAVWIDTHPRADACRLALRLRAAIEKAATDVLAHAGRAVGAGPWCRNERFARLAADLPVYLRQSHAERDLAALGALVIAESGLEWSL